MWVWPLAAALVASSLVMVIGKLGSNSSTFVWLGLAVAIAIGVTFPVSDAWVLSAAYVAPSLVVSYIELPALDFLILITPFLILVTWIAVSCGQSVRSWIRRS